MTFEEAYKNLFQSIVKYCYGRNGNDLYYAEEATVKAFERLDKKWDTLSFREEKLLKSWLTNTAENTMKEVNREAPPAHMPIEEAWCRDLVEEQQAHNQYDEEQEDYRYGEYLEEIEARLEPEDRPLFHYKIAEDLSFEEIAEKLNISENAARIRWTRLKVRIKPLTDEIIPRNC